MKWLGILFITPLGFCPAQNPAQNPVQGVPVEEFAAKPDVAQSLTISRSEQFRISGSDVRLRGSLAFLAESAKDDFLGLTREKDAWKVPISIMLAGQQGEPVRKRSIAIDLQEGDDGFKLYIHVHLAQGVDSVRLRSAVLTALVYEKSLRQLKQGQLDEPLLVRPWIAEGLTEVIQWRQGKSDRRLYQSVFQAGGLFPLEEMLDMPQKEFDESDAASRTAFRVSAGGLMMALLEQPDGTEAFQKFMAEAAQFGGDMPVLLRKHFPGLNLSQKSLEKWWALQMANQARQSLTEVMSIADTERALSDALKLRFRDAEGIPRDRELSAWQEVAALDEGARGFAVRHAEEALVKLSYRCFPSYRYLLGEYQKLLHAIVKPDKKFDIARKLVELEETRVLMNQRGARATDYLDWFEITRARETSGVFDDYMKLKQRLDQGIMQRDDHVARYLDRIEKLYQR